MTFDYSQFSPNSQKFFAVAGELPPGSLSRPEYELADLFGNGLPDILEINGTLRYWRNLGNGRFDRPRDMAEAPAGLQLADPCVQMIDADGDGRIDLLVNRNGLSGYFPLRYDGLWDRKSSQKYEFAPSFDLEDPNVKLLDLTGDGVTDAIRSGTRLECFFNDAKKGWHGSRWVERRALEDFPNLSFADPSVKWGDFSGEYWPGDPAVLSRPAAMTAALHALPRRRKRDALRAMRGSVLRTERYALDGSERQTRPYTVTESLQGVREEQPPPADSERRAIFFSFALGQRSTQWERGAEPMTQLSLMGDYDQYGRLKSQLSIGVPRGRDYRISAASALPYLASYSETLYLQRDDAQRYLVDKVARTDSYEIGNDGKTSAFGLWEAVKTGSAGKQLIGQTINLYDGPGFQGLPFGQLGDYGALVRSENLVLTDALLAFGQRGQPVSVRSKQYQHHDSDTDFPLPQRDETIETVEYSDGFGRLLQTRVQSEEIRFGDAIFGGGILPVDQNDEAGSKQAFAGVRNNDASNPNVLVSGWQIYDNKGRVIEKYEPFYSRGWQYAAPGDEQLGQKAA